MSNSTEKTHYVTVRLTAKQAYAVANAAEQEVFGRREACNKSGDERLVDQACKKLFAAWRTKVPK